MKRETKKTRNGLSSILDSFVFHISFVILVWVFFGWLKRITCGGSLAFLVSQEKNVLGYVMSKYRLQMNIPVNNM